MKLVIIYKRKKYKLEYTLKRRPYNKGYSRPRFIPKEADIYILADLIRDKKYSEKRYAQLSDFSIVRGGGTRSGKTGTSEIPQYIKNIEKAQFNEKEPYFCVKFQGDITVYNINFIDKEKYIKLYSELTELGFEGFKEKEIWLSK